MTTVKVRVKLPARIRAAAEEAVNGGWAKNRSDALCALLRRGLDLSPADTPNDSDETTEFYAAPAVAKAAGDEARGYICAAAAVTSLDYSGAILGATTPSIDQRVTIKFSAEAEKRKAKSLSLEEIDLETGEETTVLGDGWHERRGWIECRGKVEFDLANDRPRLFRWHYGASWSNHYNTLLVFNANGFGTFPENHRVEDVIDGVVDINSITPGGIPYNTGVRFVDRECYLTSGWLHFVIPEPMRAFAKEISREMTDRHGYKKHYLSPHKLYYSCVNEFATDVAEVLKLVADQHDVDSSALSGVLAAAERAAGLGT